MICRPSDHTVGRARLETWTQGRRSIEAWGLWPLDNHTSFVAYSKEEDKIVRLLWTLMYFLGPGKDMWDSTRIIAERQFLVSRDLLEDTAGMSSSNHQNLTFLVWLPQKPLEHCLPVLQRTKALGGFLCKVLFSEWKYPVSTTQTNFLIYSESADANLYIRKCFQIYWIFTYILGNVS